MVCVNRNDAISHAVLFNICACKNKECPILDVTLF